MFFLEGKCSIFKYFFTFLYYENDCKLANSFKLGHLPCAKFGKVSKFPEIPL